MITSYVPWIVVSRGVEAVEWLRTGVSVCVCVCACACAGVLSVVVCTPDTESYSLGTLRFHVHYLGSMFVCMRIAYLGRFCKA
jgi:hypothetical protein